jgi:hypothetical protein
MNPLSAQEKKRLTELAKEAAKVAARVREGELSQAEGVKQLMAPPYNLDRLKAQSWFMTPPVVS